MPSFLVILVAVFLIGASSAQAAERALAVAPSTTVALRMMDMTWEEFDQQGVRLLEESGYLLGLDLHHSINRGGQPEATLLAHGFLGEVDYDGATQLGVPLKSTTEYVGGGLEADLGINLHLTPRLYIKPNAGLGLRTWLRRLDNTGRFEGSGYNEWWLVTYAKFGLYAGWYEQGVEWFLDTSVRVPLSTRAEYDFGFLDENVSVTPGKTPGWSAEFGRATRRTLFSLFIEQWDFDRSNLKSVPGYDIFQFQSESRIIGVRFGVRF